MSDEAARRLWLMPPASGLMNDLDLSLLDPSDEDERQMLLVSEHPELWTRSKTTSTRSCSTVM